MTSQKIGVQFGYTTEKIVKSAPGHPELNSGDFLLDAFRRRQTSLGIRRFFYRYQKDLIFHRFKTSDNREFRAFKFGIEQIEAMLLLHFDPKWEITKNRIVENEALLWGFSVDSQETSNTA